MQPKGECTSSWRSTLSDGRSPVMLHLPFTITPVSGTRVAPPECGNSNTGQSVKHAKHIYWLNKIGSSVLVDCEWSEVIVIRLRRNDFWYPGSNNWDGEMVLSDKRMLLYIYRPASDAWLMFNLLQSFVLSASSLNTCSTTLRLRYSHINSPPDIDILSLPWYTKPVRTADVKAKLEGTPSQSLSPSSNQPR